MQPSTRFLCGLSPSQTAWVQHRFFEVVRSAQPRSDDPETVLAVVTQKLQVTVNDERAHELLQRQTALREEALELALNNPGGEAAAQGAEGDVLRTALFGAHIIRGNGSISSLNQEP
jgi:hypothetical protein